MAKEAQSTQKDNKRNPVPSSYSDFPLLLREAVCCSLHSQHLLPSGHAVTFHTRSQPTANASGRALRSRVSSPACCQLDNPRSQLMCANLPCVSDSELRIPGSNQHGSNVSCSQVTQNRTKLSGMKLSPQKPNVRKSFQQDLLESAPKRRGSPIIRQRNIKLD